MVCINWAIGQFGKRLVNDVVLNSVSSGSTWPPFSGSVRATVWLLDLRRPRVFHLFVCHPVDRLVQCGSESGLFLSVDARNVALVSGRKASDISQVSAFCLETFDTSPAFLPLTVAKLLTPQNSPLLAQPLDLRLFLCFSFFTIF